LAVFLDSAAANFETAKDKLGLADESVLVLLLCDDFRFNVFARLRAKARAGKVEAGWTLDIGDEDDAVVARKAGGREIHICAGRQIRTTDGLEVLAVCTDDELPDGLCLRKTLDLVHATRGIPVIPWGFGKWIGRRGRIVSELFDGYSREMFLAGDNGGRPQGFSEPRLFKRARHVGMPILAGSDPLPFPGEERCAGRYGVHTIGIFDPDNACASVRKILKDQAGQFQIFGCLEQPFRFVRNQVRMQMKKFQEKNHAEES
jgi:hypothetical protein